MPENTVMHARIDAHIKEETAVMLPFEPYIPSAETIAAMNDVRHGKLPTFKSVDALLADLNGDD